MMRSSAESIDSVASPIAFPARHRGAFYLEYPLNRVWFDYHHRSFFLPQKRIPFFFGVNLGLFFRRHI